MTKIILEPELQLKAALWTPNKRRAVARKLERWARQLRISAIILEKNHPPIPPPRPRVLPLRRLRLN